MSVNELQTYASMGEAIFDYKTFYKFTLSIAVLSMSMRFTPCQVQNSVPDILKYTYIYSHTQTHRHTHTHTHQSITYTTELEQKRQGPQHTHTNNSNYAKNEFTHLCTTIMP